MKTKKIVDKRFKINKSGKILRRTQGLRHLRTDKSKRQLRKYRKAAFVDSSQTGTIRTFLPYN